jgi:glycosyltransferase involved in cell wall biosynthesis
MSEPRRVTVGVPTVNRRALLWETIDSLAKQTYRDFEIVLADNSADPDYQREVDRLIAAYPGLDFILMRHPQRLAPIDNFNRLIDAGRGEYWTCLPDDDRFCPNFLERSVAALDNHPDCAFTFADHWIIDSEGARNQSESDAYSARYGRTKLHERVYEHREVFGLAINQSICLQSMLFRRTLISSLRLIPGILSGDHSLFLRIGAAAEPWHGYYISERLFEYRLHGEQITSASRRKDLLQSQIAAFESVPRVPAPHRRTYNAKLAANYLALAYLEAEASETASARTHALRGAQLSPRPGNILGALLVTAAPGAVKRARQLRQLWRSRLTHQT